MAATTTEHFDWAFGYCAARGYAEPVAATIPSALWFDAGKPDQAGRFILGRTSSEAAAAAFAAVKAPHIYVDIAAPRDAILSHIPQHWQPRDPMWLMAATSDGKALYERLGWTLRSDIVSVISPPA